MRVNRKLMRRFEYVSTAIMSPTMGFYEIVKVTSEELPDWKVYQFTQNETVRTYKEEFVTTISVTTETIKDFPSYNEALAYAAGIEKAHKDANEWRTNLPTHPGTYKFNTTEKNI